MSNKPLSPAQARVQTLAAEKKADAKRSAAKSVLPLADLANEKNVSIVEKALNEINRHTRDPFAKQLTPELLQQFAKNLKRLQNEYQSKNIQGGISPRAIINRSRRIDINRATTEIHNVIPISYTKDGVINFKTSASRQSNASHHIVSVQFLNFQAALNAIASPTKLADFVLQGGVKFDCDCGRHRYWYRYIASVGGFNYSKAETAFPKIRNPELTGLACKHVIRTMGLLLKSPAMKGYMRDFLQRYRKNPNQNRQTATAKQAKKLQQTINNESWSRHFRRSKTGQSLPDAKAFFNPQNPVSIQGMTVTPQEMSKAMKQQATSSDLNKARLTVQRLLAGGIITQSDYDALLAGIK